VEVLSPTDTVAAVRREIRQYLAAGALYVWVVYPETREVEVWREPARAQVALQETDLLEAPDLLPGFALRAGALFA
jgi:Uma2 family endonuclease